MARRWYNKWLTVKFKSSTIRTPEYIKFENEYKKHLKKLCEDNGFELVKFIPEHFKFSAFIKNVVTDKYVYMHIPDVRYTSPCENGWTYRILVRACKNVDDYTGGTNNSSDYENLLATLKTLTKGERKIEKPLDVAKLLNVDFTSSSEDPNFIKAFSSLRYVYGKDFEEVEDAILINKTYFKAFEILVSTIVIYVAYTYRLCEKCEHYDVRNEDMYKFCGEHFEDFQKLYRELVGKDIPLTPYPQYKYFFSDHNFPLSFRTLELEVNDFSKEHPVIQQSMFSKMMKTLYRGGVLTDITNAKFFT